MTSVLLIITIAAPCNHSHAGKFIITPTSTRSDGLLRIECDAEAVHFEGFPLTMFSAPFTSISKHFEKGVVPLPKKEDVEGVVTEAKKTLSFSYKASGFGSAYDGEYTPIDVYESGDNKLMASCRKSVKK